MGVRLVFRDPQQLDALLVGGEHGVERGGRPTRRFLRQKPDAVPARHDDIALVGQQAAADQVEQRRLAGAVASDKPELAALGDLRVGLVEEGTPVASPDTVGQAGNRQHRGLLS